MDRPTVLEGSALSTWLIWTAGFLAFPIAGLAGTAVAGRVDGLVPALLGGTVAGLVLGTAQVLVSRGRLDPRRWIPATGIGMGLGLALGGENVNYSTTATDLGLMGLVTGFVLGVAQALALPARAHSRWGWAAAMAPLWSLGWIVTTFALIDVEKQYTIFGVTGAVVFMAISGLLLERLLPQLEADPTDEPDVPPDVHSSTAPASPERGEAGTLS
jgi:hypothetical protein